MAKIFNYYTNNVDKTWYDSSNVKYSECIDHDNELKTLKIVFNNGTQYQYNEVNVNKYLLFREDLSQGKALNKYIKSEGYEYEKLENADMENLQKELEFRQKGGIFISYEDNHFQLKDNKDNIICEKKIKLNQETFDLICTSLEAVGKELYIEKQNFEDNGEEG